MSEYININQQSKSGKLAISRQVFSDLVSDVINNMGGVSLKKKTKGFSLLAPVNVSINKGIVHIRVVVDLKKDSNIQEFTSRIQNEIANVVLAYTDQVPFDIQVRVESLF